MQSPSRCNKRTGRYRQANNPVSSTASRAMNGNLGKFEAVENNGTAFVPKQCLHQKVDVGMENPEMQSPSRCNKRTGRYCAAKNPVSCMHVGPTMEIWENSKMSKTMVPPLHQSNVSIKR